MIGMAGSTNTFHLLLVAVVATSLTTLLCRATRDTCVLGHTCRMWPRDPALPHASQVMHVGVHTSTYGRQKFAYINPLSQEGEAVAAQPLSDFPSCRFCVFAKIAIRSIYPPFVQIPMYL